LGGAASTAKQLTRSASPARHPRQRDEELAEDVGLEKQEEAV